MTLYSGGAGSYDVEEVVEFTERVVHIRRVAKVVKGGRHLSFNAMVVVGDGHGRVGVGLGKGAAVPDAVRKGNSIARRALVLVPLRGSTIPHAVRAGYGASQVLIKPAPAGAGIVAGGALRAVMEAAGIRDVVAKALGSRNPINVVKATLEGLQRLQGGVAEEQSNEPPLASPAPTSRHNGQASRPRRDLGPRGVASTGSAEPALPQTTSGQSEVPAQEVETAQAAEVRPSQPEWAEGNEAPTAEGDLHIQDAGAVTAAAAEVEAPESGAGEEREGPLENMATEEAEAPATEESEGSEDGQATS